MRTKIGLMFGTLALLLLLLTSAVVRNIVGQQVETESSASLLRTARLIAFTFDKEIQERQRDLQALADLLSEQRSRVPVSALSADPMPGHRRILQDFQTRYGLRWVALTDARGQIQVASDPELERQDFSSAAWFAEGRQVLFARDTLPSDWPTSLATKPSAAARPRMGVALVVPVPSRGPSLAGALAAELGEPWVDTLRSRLKLLVPPDQLDQLEVQVTARNGTTITQHNTQAAWPAPSQELAPAGCWVDGTNPDTRYSTCSVISEGHQAFPGFGWRVTIRLPEKVAFVTANKLENQIALIGLLAALLFTLLGWLLADRISKPIRAMARAADRIAAGDRELALPVTGRDEIAQLGRSLSSLLTTLHRDEAELVKTNQLLEARVVERTQSLEKAVADLQGANTDLDRFASMVSHDLLAPVRAMRTFSELLLIDYAADLPDEAQRLLSRVDQAGLDMSNLVHALHGLSKLGQKPLQVLMTDMTAIAEQAVQANMPAWAGKSIVVHPLPACHCDPAMLRVVFDNLLGNAVKYSQKQQDPHIEVNGQLESDRCVYWVSDNGAGFDPQYAHRLFQIFQRLHSARDYPGTGVGLATVARIVQRHGGHVWADGSPGEGATFYFSLPVRSILDAAPSASPEPPQAGSGVRLMPAKS